MTWQVVIAVGGLLFAVVVMWLLAKDEPRSQRQIDPGSVSASWLTAHRDVRKGRLSS